MPSNTRITPRARLLAYATMILSILSMPLMAKLIKMLSDSTTNAMLATMTYFAFVMWAVFVSIALLWQHRRAVRPKPSSGGYKLNWTAEDGIFAPRETV